MSDDSRYSRQIRFAPFGENSQKKLAASRVAVLGCGALGSVVAERLVRSGAGTVRLIDRDWVEFSNLQRQSLYTESDASDAVPKAVAAAEHLKQINSSIAIESVVEDVTFDNLRPLLGGVDLIVDGTDNFETRFLLNDYCVANGVPWVHGGCLGAGGQVMSIVPGQTACFRCLLPEPPPRDAMQTCDTAGVLGPAVGLIACWQAAEALKILAGHQEKVCPGLIVLDSWLTDMRIIQMSPAPKCPTCSLGEFPYLSGEIRSESTILCGKNAVQILGEKMPAGSLAALERTLASIGSVKRNAYFLRLEMAKYTITLFASGRSVVEGTTDIAEAKSVLARSLGG